MHSIGLPDLVRDGDGASLRTRLATGHLLTSITMHSCASVQVYCFEQSIPIDISSAQMVRWAKMKQHGDGGGGGVSGVRMG